MTDAAGNITDTFAYDTYGKVISRTGTSSIIFGYNGRDGVITEANGLIYMRARYYSPDMRRFVNADIIHGFIDDSTSLNRYAYVNGNPVSYVDPFGLLALIVIGAIVGGVTSFVSSIIAEAIEGDITLRDVGQIAVSTTIGMVEGAAIVACPSASVAISAVASAADTAINDIIDEKSVDEIVVDALVSGAFGAIAGAGGSDIKKNGDLINDAVESIGDCINKGVHPVVKKTAKKTVKKAAKSIARTYVSGQADDLAYSGIDKFTSFYIMAAVQRCK